MNFTEQDIKQIEEKGLTLIDVKKQIAQFKIGIPYTNIYEAATLNHGIIELNGDLIDRYIAFFESKKNSKYNMFLRQPYELRV